MKSIITACCLLLFYINDITAQQYGSVVVNVKDDAHCEGGTSENTNYGLETSIRTKFTTTTNSSYNRKSYLKFDISGVARENIGLVQLKLYPNLIQGSDYSIDLFESLANWDENSITWANSPVFASKITSFPCGVAAQWSLIDITDYVLNLPSNTSELSFALYASVLNSSNQTLWNSGEAATNWPALEFIYKANTPTSASATVVSTSQIDLVWDKTGCNASSFLIERKKSGGNFSLLTEIDANNEALYSDLTIDSQYSYTYRITAKNNEGINASPIEAGTIGTMPFWYVTSTCNHPQSHEVLKGSINNQMLLIEIEMQGSTEPYRLKTLNLGLNGTESIASVAMVNVFHTGNSPVFSTANRFGISVMSPSTNELSVNGDLTLVEGKNYLWVTFSIRNNAVSEHTLDAQCNSIIIDNGTPITKIPQVIAPDGNRLVSIHSAETAILRIGETTIANSSYNGTNAVSFTQDMISTYKDYQYAAFWTNNKRVAVARKRIIDSNWDIAELSDYTTTNDLKDNHYNISMGLCYTDGTIHLSYDHHNHELNYRISAADIINNPQDYSWNENLFGLNRNYLVAGTVITKVTYPRFITKPNGDLLFEIRKDGGSGNANNYLYEYNGTSKQWATIGKFIDGRVSIGGVTRSAYFNGIQYDAQGKLHAAWCWRTTSGGYSNHDLNYVYSPDHGRTWYNTYGVKIGTTGSDPLKADKPGLVAYKIPMNRSLMNQESMCIDSNGRVHVLNGIITDESPDVALWGTAYPVHFYRNDDGTWQKDFMMLEAKKNRDQILCDQFNNIYIVLDNNIYRATEASKWTDWKVVAQKGTNGGYSGDGQVDKRRLLEENVLAIGSGKGTSLVEINYLVDRKLDGTGTGLTTEFFEGSEFTKRSHHINSNIDFHWDASSTEEYIKTEGFSGRINGKLQTRYAETYTIHLTTSEKARCWVNGTLIIDAWSNSSTNHFSAQLPRLATHFYDIKIEVTYSTIPASVKLEWESLRQPRTVVPLNECYSGILSPIETKTTMIPHGGQLLSVSPNPTDGIITFNVNDWKLNNEHITITDALGRVVSPAGLVIINSMAKIDLSNLKAGIYFIRVQSSDLYVAKIIKH
jgi:hypothetical protein